MRLTIACLLLSQFSFQLTAQDINVEAAVEKDTIYIGDQIYYTVNIQQPSDLKLGFFTPADTLTESLLIIESRRPDSTYLKNKKRIAVSHRFLITSFDTGFYEIPPFYVSYINQGEEVRYYSDYTSLEVINTYIAPADSTEVIFDIVAPYSQPVAVKELLPWVLLAIVIAVAVWYIIRRIRNSRGRDGDEPLVKIPSEPLHIIALRELDRLDRKKIWQQGEIKLFYTCLVTILKQYLSGRYSISCLEMTTDETLEALRSNGLNNEKAGEGISEILSTADLSKFAKYKPGDDLNSIMIERAKEIVRLLASAAQRDNEELIGDRDKLPVNPEELKGNQISKESQEYKGKGIDHGQQATEAGQKRSGKETRQMPGGQHEKENDNRRQAMKSESVEPGQLNKPTDQKKRQAPQDSKGGKIEPGQLNKPTDQKQQGSERKEADDGE